MHHNQHMQTRDRAEGILYTFSEKLGLLEDRSWAFKIQINSSEIIIFFIFFYTPVKMPHLYNSYINPEI